MLYALNFHILCISNKSVKLEIVTSFKNRDLPGGPVTNKTSPSKAGDAGSTPDWEVKIPHASQPKNTNIKKKIKQKQYYKFNKDFKNGLHQKIFKKQNRFAVALRWGCRSWG